VSAEVPHSPTSTPKADARSHGDAPPPLPPHELPRDAAPARRFTHEGRSWVAWLSGKGAYGTGSYGLGLIDAVHFADAAAPDLPLRESLLAHGRFEQLFDAELAALLNRSVEIRPADGRQSPPPRRP
jgi:hypothetical protein